MNRLIFLIAEHRLPKLIFKTPWIGIFQDYREALAAIPRSMKVGFDHDALGKVFSNYPLGLVRPADYPILLHLSQLLHPGLRVIDFGGNVGMACYLASRYLKLPPSLRWTICDVPTIIDAARQVAQREGSLQNVLRFTTGLEEAGHCEIFFSSGTLHHLERSLADLLRKLPELPSSVLVNRIPVWDQPAFTTIAIHFGTRCATPTRIFNRRQFTQEMEELGYHLVDDWQCPESSLSIRFHPGIRIHAYHGFYFSRTPLTSDLQKQENAIKQTEERTQEIARSR